MTVLLRITPPALILMLFAACQGPVGPDGDNARVNDSLPPTIEWIRPEPGDTVAGIDTLQVRVDDDQGIYKVAFYIAGFEFSSTLTDTVNNIYDCIWDATLYPEGPYPLMARVWDTSRLTATTPVRVVEVKH
jgi:hypothetical protein